MLLLLLVICGVVGAATGRRTISVTTDYERPQEGWITLDLHQETVRGRSPVVTRIEWCKSIMPTPSDFEGPMPPDINGCKGRGLMHMQLYPGVRPLVRTQVDEPHTLYIDPINVGGWDENHQANVIVHATVDDATDLVQVFRFNPISDLPVSSIAPSPPTTTKTTTTTKRPTTTKTTTTKTTTSTVLSAGTLTKMTDTPTAEPTTTTIEAAAKYSITGMAVIFGVGAFLMLSLGLLNYARMANWSLDRFRRRHGYFDFGLQSGQEMEFLSGDDDDVVEMDDMQKMEILKQLGTGAMPAFTQNQQK